MGNEHLQRAMKNKNDEFYTLYEDVQKGLEPMMKLLEGKKILLPCDDEKSEFYHFFQDKVKDGWLDRGSKLPQVWATHYAPPPCLHSYKLYVDGTFKGVWGSPMFLKGNGDFFSEEVQRFVEQSDVIITNPPFSREAEMIKLLLDKGKDFILIGTESLLTHRILFPFVKEGKIHAYGSVKKFKKPSDDYQTFGNCCWITSFTPCATAKFVPTKKYEEVKDLMKPYENYAAVNVDKLANVPMDYDGVMGVPVTYLKKRNDEMFEILGFGSAHSPASGLQYNVTYTPLKIDHGGNPVIDGRLTYVRIFIKNITI